MLPLVLAGFGALAAGLAPEREERSTTSPPTPVSPPRPVTMNGRAVPVTLTAYYPKESYASAAEARMEGGMHDSRGRTLITLQQHMRDPKRYPHTSLSRDPSIFPYGQKVYLSAFGKPPAWWTAITGEPWYVGRMVDTGCHFRNDPKARKCGSKGAVKVFRNPGHEPVDVAMEEGGKRLGVVKTAMIVAPEPSRFMA